MANFKDITIGDIVTICCEKGDCDECRMKNASSKFVVIGKVATTTNLNDGIVKLDFGDNPKTDFSVRASEICKVYKNVE